MDDVACYTDKMKNIDDDESYSATAKDLLVAAAGEEHAQHDVVACNRWSDVEAGAYIRFLCSCGVVFKMAPSNGRRAALKDVPSTLLPSRMS